MSFLSNFIKKAAPVVAAVAPSKMAMVTIDITWDERKKDGDGSVSKTFTTTTNICTANPC